MNRERQRLIERLEMSAQDLVSYLGKFSEQELYAHPTPDEWNIHQIAAHLRDTEEQVFLYRVKRILREDNPAVMNFDQTLWSREHYLVDEPIEKIIARFRSARREQIRLLRRTNDKDWLRTARHSTYGTISLDWLVSHAANHTLEHIAQIGYGYENGLLRALNADKKGL